MCKPKNHIYSMCSCFDAERSFCNPRKPQGNKPFHFLKKITEVSHYCKVTNICLGSWSSYLRCAVSTRVCWNRWGKPSSSINMPLSSKLIGTIHWMIRVIFSFLPSSCEHVEWFSFERSPFEKCWRTLISHNMNWNFPFFNLNNNSPCSLSVSTFSKYICQLWQEHFTFSGEAIICLHCNYL